MGNLNEILHTESDLGSTSLSIFIRPIRDIWDGMKGKISVIHSGWNPEVAASRIATELDTEDTQFGTSLRDKGVNEEQLHAVIVKIAKYNNLLVEGDIIATDHVLSILRFLYDPRYITVKNSWSFGLSRKQVEENNDFINMVKSHNLVLVCGPLGNLVTDILLNKAGLSWLFDSNDKHVILTHPDQNRSERLISLKFRGSDKLRTDFGVFLRCQNPFNQSRRMYAIMGAHSYGTQGAAALACNYKSTTELLSTKVDPDIQSSGVDYIAWVKVWRERIPSFVEFSDPKLRYQIICPVPEKKEWEEHINPSAIHEAQDMLRTSLLENTLFLGAQPSKLILYSFGLSAVVLLICTLLLTTYRFPIIIVALAPVVVGTAKMFFSLISPPAKQNFRTKLARLFSLFKKGDE